MIRSISDAAKSFLPKRLMPQDVQDFFVYLMEEAIKYRDSNSINRDDFLAHIISLKKKKEMSEIEMVAHGVTFFLGNVIPLITTCYFNIWILSLAC